MSSVPIHAVTHDSVHSPFFSHPSPLYIEGRFYTSVAEYMSQCTESTCANLLKGMMAKYSQNIHLQKVFHDNNVSLVFDKTSIASVPGWVEYLDHVYAQVADQYSLCFDAHRLLCIVPREDGESHEDWVLRTQYFHAAQPAVGRDRAVYLSRLWLDKRMKKVTYDYELEEEISSFDIVGK